MPSVQDLRLADPPGDPPRAGRIAVLLRIAHGVRHPRPGSRPIGPLRWVMHWVRCAVHLDTFRDWYGDAAHPALRSELAARPQLVTCVVHPYLNTGWSAEQKLAVIGAHYRLLTGRMSIVHCAAPTVLALAGEDLRLQLERPGKFEHEGERTLQLRRGQQGLYAIAFTLGRIGNQGVAYVGALQGLSDPDALDIYRELTHRMHGLRPRDFLITAFRQLCNALGVMRILAVEDAARVSSSAYFASSARVFASYDAAWGECGGVAVGGGFIELSVWPTRREPGAVPARKRAMYRRRYEMLDGLAQQIDAAVATHGAGSVKA